MGKKTLIGAVIMILLFSCQQSRNNSGADMAQGRYKLTLRHPDPFLQNPSKYVFSDTLEIFFRMENRETDERFRNLSDLQELDFVLEEWIGNTIIRERPQYVPGSLRRNTDPDASATTEERRTRGINEFFSTNAVVSLVVDSSGSMDPYSMQIVRENLREFVSQLEGANVFISWFHSTISSSQRIDADNMEQFLPPANYRPCPSCHTLLYNSFYVKLLEFVPDAEININYTGNPGYIKNPELSDTTFTERYLIVLTDGEDDFASAFRDRRRFGVTDLDPVGRVKLLDFITEFEKENKVEIFAIGYENLAGVIDSLPLIQITGHGFPAGRKRFFQGGHDDISDIFQDISDQIAWDYSIKFVNPPRNFRGERRNLQLTVKSEGQSIGSGGLADNGYILYGTRTNILNKNPQTDAFRNVLWGLFAAFIFLVFLIVIVQLIYPLMANKIFQIKFVKKTREVKDKVTLPENCLMCLQPFEDHERIVVKCEHTIHWECWKDNNHSCPELGQNCKTGKQIYFDTQDPFSKKNRGPYFNWIIGGIFGGILSWLLFQLNPGNYLNGFSEFIISLLTGSEFVSDAFQNKISSNLVIGSYLGFFLSLFFIYTEEYRSISNAVIVKVLLRALAGLGIGFLAFLIGSLPLIAFRIDEASILLDWIPWLLFGVAVGFSLSYKTNISWKHGLIGGGISIIFGFIMLYANIFAQDYLSVLIAFMVYGAGLAFSIATVRAMAEKYFLKVIGGKRTGMSIAVHKWLGSGVIKNIHVGKSTDCEIQINWEKEGAVADKHVKIFIHPNKRKAVIISMEEGMNTQLNNRIDMETGKEYFLNDHDTFKISETTFRYEENN